MKFDDFKDFEGDLIQNFCQLALKFSKIFCKKSGLNKVDDLKVVFKQQPFLDIVILFAKNGQVVLFDISCIKQKNQKEMFDSLLAQIFAELEPKEITALCQKLETALKQACQKKIT